MKFKDIIYDIYNKCLYSPTNGYEYDPVVLDGHYYDSYLLTKNKDAILDIKKRIDDMADLKDKPYYQEEIGNSLEKLELLCKALEVAPEVDLNDRTIVRRYNSTEKINKLLSFYGFQMRFNEFSDRLVDVISNEERLLVQGLATRVSDNNSDAIIIDFKIADKCYQIYCSFSGDDIEQVKVEEEKDNGDKRLITMWNDFSAVIVMAAQDDNKTVIINSLSLGNKNNLISIKNSIIDKQRGRETSTSEVTIKNDNYVNKSDTTFVKNASRLEKRIELEGEKIYINSMIPVTIIEEERENIYNELVSHMIVRKPIIENLSLVDKVFPGLEKYLLDKHRFVLDELDKDYPPGEVVDELIKSLYSEYYNYEENEPTL